MNDATRDTEGVPKMVGPARAVAQRLSNVSDNPTWFLLRSVLQ
jgi:hypothetical protein